MARKKKAVTAAHDQAVTNHYVLHFPPHEPRETDPHYAAFNAFRSHHAATAVCVVGQRVGFDQCADAQGKAMKDQPGHPGLELHHAHVEFSLINAVDLKAIQVDFPDLKDADAVAAWAESAQNFEFLCARHHRGPGGVHHAAHADFEAEMYIRGLIGPFEK